MFPRNIKNRIALAKSYLLRKDRLNAFPFEVALGITNRCNLDCVFCPRRFGRRPPGNMSLDLLKNLLAQVAPYVDAVDLSFDGEPFLHPQWVECVEACHQRGIRAILQTNALLMDESLAREVLAVGVDSITFSIDAATPETYFRLKPAGDFERVVANAERFLRLARSRSRRPVMTVQFIRTPENAPEVETFLRHWRGRGADYIRVKPLMNFAGSLGQSPRRPLRKPCILLWPSIAVHWDGAVPLCCMEIEGRTKMGDANKERLESIIDNEAFREVRELHLKGRAREHPVCRNCDVPTVSWPYVIGSTLVGDFARRHLIGIIQRFSSLQSRR